MSIYGKLNRAQYWKPFVFFILVCCSFILRGVGLSDSSKKKLLKSGWYHFKPYQYLKNPGDKNSLTGLTIELQKMILDSANYKYIIPKTTWREMLVGIKEGTQDILFDVYYSKEIEKFGVYTDSFNERKESAFYRQKDASIHSYKNEKELIEVIKKNNLKIAVISDFVYVSKDINKFIKNPDNQQYIIKTESNEKNLDLLLRKKIDIFVTDYLIGATLIWNEKAGFETAMYEFETSMPTYILLSRKSTTEDDLKRINRAIADMKKDNDYKSVAAWYLYPIILLNTTQSRWFYFLSLVGMIAFVISGIILSYQYGATLLGTCLLCLIPSFGGGLLRDLILGKYPVWFMTAKGFLVQSLALAILGFIILKIIQVYKIKKPKQIKFDISTKHWDYLLNFFEGIGVASFAVSGVMVCLVVKAEPLYLWGPFFAFLSGAGGGLLRDILLRNRSVAVVTGAIAAEVAILWGLILSLYLTLTITPDHFNLIAIKYFVVFSVIGCVATRLLIKYFGIANLYISKEIGDNIEQEK